MTTKFYRARYNANTHKVIGTYPNFISYPNNIIDEDNETIDGDPYIEISEEQHTEHNGKRMAVIDGIYQEYIPTTEESLAAAKTSKIAEIKSIRDSENLTPIDSIQAKEITELDGVFTLTDNNVGFKFRVESTGQPATEPSTLVLGVLIASASVPDYYIRYSCDIIDTPNRKGYVAIDAAASASIQAYIADRSTNNIAKANSLESDVEEAATIEEVNNINW